MNTVLFIWSMSGLAWLITSAIITSRKEINKGSSSDENVATYCYYLFFYFCIGLVIVSLL